MNTLSLFSKSLVKKKKVLLRDLGSNYLTSPTPQNIYYVESLYGNLAVKKKSGLYSKIFQRSIFSLLPLQTSLHLAVYFINSSFVCYHETKSSVLL